MPTPAKLSPRQLAAIPLLASGRGPVAVAEAVGLNRRQVTRWLTEPGFRQAPDLARREMWSETLDRLRGLMPKALDVLATELDGEGKARAAAEILKLAGLGKIALDPAANDLEERLARLEEELPR